MKIKYQGHKKRTEIARELWEKIAELYNSGISPEDIRLNHIDPNPKTGKPYSRGHIYLALARVQGRIRKAKVIK